MANQEDRDRLTKTQHRAGVLLQSTAGKTVEWRTIYEDLHRTVTDSKSVVDRTDEVNKIERDIDKLIDRQNNEMGFKWCYMILSFLVVGICSYAGVRLYAFNNSNKPAKEL